MGVNGQPWAECISARENFAKLPPSSSFLVNGLRLPRPGEAGYNGKRTGLHISAADSQGAVFDKIAAAWRSRPW
jgi:hypothetical protein